MSKNRFASREGFTLVEVLVAVALLSLLGATFIGGLTLSSRVLIHGDTRETSRDIAQAQLEFVQNQTFVALTLNVTSSPYNTAPIPSQNSGYSAAVTAISETDVKIQKITVTVSQGGANAFTLEGKKVQW
jgi:prepilin-type N-terminal cleavage/methylation domain-containing protein